MHDGASRVLPVTAHRVKWKWVRTLMEETKLLAVTKQEAELIMDSFKVSNPLTRDIALKAAGLVLEFAAEADVRNAARLTGPHPVESAVLS